MMTEPGVLPIAHLGVVDGDGTDITESELLSHDTKRRGLIQRDNEMMEDLVAPITCWEAFLHFSRLDRVDSR